MGWVDKGTMRYNWQNRSVDRSRQQRRSAGQQSAVSSQPSPKKKIRHHTKHKPTTQQYTTHDRDHKRCTSFITTFRRAPTDQIETIRQQAESLYNNQNQSHLIHKKATAPKSTQFHSRHDKTKYSFRHRNDFRSIRRVLHPRCHCC